ncbi:uncharacterized protein LOC116928633 [Daphnia magna]|uniref:uncharacterized protein LOC116928633 n=1 Tax=Daphnia magna TaxID=35525 RepID=UPI001E1BCE31|nr:uncharacterized protein LOC116928633 [Daphnia magna]
MSTIPVSEWSDPSLNLDLDDLPIERTLGMIWNCQLDTLQIKTRMVRTVNTKRDMLAAMSSIFDPLGILLPVTTKVKILFQETWRINVGQDSVIGWDERLSTTIRDKWRKWADELPLLNTLTIPRCIFSKSHYKGTNSITIHVFSDASASAFGAIAYMWTTNGNESDVSFLMAKARIAPIKKVTIPRLELQAAVLAIRLATTLKSELRIKVDYKIFWIDSEIVLRWINSSHCLYSEFVSNRISELLDKSSPDQWRFVPGEKNPADYCTRGILPSSFDRHHQWLTGPSFLRQPEEKWPTKLQLKEDGCDDGEFLPAQPFISNINVNFSENNQISSLIKELPSLTDLERAVASIQIKESVNPDREIGVDELEAALNTCILLAQEECFEKDIKSLRSHGRVHRMSSLLTLSPFMDPRGVVRVGGRLNHANIPECTRHPIILKEDHVFTLLVVKHCHSVANHAGIERTLAEVRSRYWILKGRRTIRGVVKRCVICRKVKAKPQQPMMAALPKERLEAFSPPFTNVGVDFFGPMYVVVGRRREKRYGCLFTCFVTRAVHLEIAHKLDTDSFIMAFRRFIAIRGTPAVVFSDNGTNLVAGEREMQAGMDNLTRKAAKCPKEEKDCNLDHKKISEEMARRRLVWRFSPPSAPHFGGGWERIVQSSKRALRVVLQDRAVCDEVLLTTFAEVTSILNGRLLSKVSTDADELEPLTPNHFLLLRPHPHIPPDEEKAFTGHSRRRWKQAQFIVYRFWKIWIAECIPNGIERKKWFKETRQLQLGDQVLIIDENTRRGDWISGVVTKVNIGDGQIVRSATVTTKNGTYTRPAVKLCLL